MLTIHFFKGLPGSGKSTEAERMVLMRPGAYTRVNKDSLRAMLHGGYYSQGNEAEVLRARDELILLALKAGRHVIVDDTNFEPKHRARIDELASAFCQATGRDVRVVERFFDVPLDECIARDLKRPNSVGEQVIRRMWKQYLGPKVQAPEIIPHYPDLPSCVIVDLDGTLAKMKGRGPFEWEKVGQDELHRDVLELVRLVAVGGNERTVHTIICSGRDAVCRPQTEAWLKTHGVDYHALYMRPKGSREKDSDLKRWIYHSHIQGRYNVLYVIDDRDQVVRMWRDLGLRCLQVADGNF